MFVDMKKTRRYFKGLKDRNAKTIKVYKVFDKPWDGQKTLSTPWVGTVVRPGTLMKTVGTVKYEELWDGMALAENAIHAYRTKRDAYLSGWFPKEEHVMVEIEVPVKDIIAISYSDGEISLRKLKIPKNVFSIMKDMNL